MSKINDEYRKILLIYNSAKNEYGNVTYEDILKSHGVDMQKEWKFIKFRKKENDKYWEMKKKYNGWLDGKTMNKNLVWTVVEKHNKKNERWHRSLFQNITFIPNLIRRSVTVNKNYTDFP